MANLVTLTDPPLNRGGRLGLLNRAVLYLGAAGDVVFGPTEGASQRQDVMRRALVVGAILVILPIQRMHIPGWQAIVIGCAAALAYNVPLAILVFKAKRYFFARSAGLVLDSIVLMAASFYVFQEMGAVGSTSAIWLVFLVYIVTGGFTLAPAGSLAYTGLWTCWFALITVMHFPQGSLYFDQMPARLIFLALIGLVSLGMANELQKKRAKLEQQNRQTMGMLATLVEARDTDAGAHLHSIQEFSRALAKRLGFSGKEIEEIAYASMMHDVGKANIPDSVLQNPGKLSPAEWRIMRDHTAWGDQLLSENDDFELARLVARSHHEHWDGSGYPDGLSGKEIPLVARLVAVADVYDALISERPYKEGWTQLEAIREIERIAGSHLDPDIAKAFVALWNDGTIKSLERLSTDPAAQRRAA